MLLHELTELSRRVAETRQCNGKIKLIAECLASAPSSERGLAALYLTGAVRQAKLGLGYAQLGSARDTPPASTCALHGARAGSRRS